MIAIGPSRPIQSDKIVRIASELYWRRRPARECWARGANPAAMCVCFAWCFATESASSYVCVVYGLMSMGSSPARTHTQRTAFDGPPRRTPRRGAPRSRRCLPRPRRPRGPRDVAIPVKF